MSTTQTVLAIYENGILRPLEPLTLTERTQVSVTVTTAVDEPTGFDSIMGGTNGAKPAPTVEDVRKITSKIPVSLSQLVREERDNDR